MSKKEFTPTQDLLLEVLIARHRLGEQLWTFSSGMKNQLEQLETLGWVRVIHGVVENSVRACLTERGKARWLSFNYKNPVKVKGWDKRQQEAQALKEKFLAKGEGW
jgi:hypothetical protein